MAPAQSSLQNRVESLRFRIEGLTELRPLVDLPRECDITPRQWAVLEPQLHGARNRLSLRVKAAWNRHTSAAPSADSRRRLNATLGDAELRLARAYGFFDTYVDVITQRHSRRLGPLLAGCDVLAWDAIRRDHPALRAVEPPLVYCDRGFGASIIREEVTFPDGTPNPMPLIQIPYSRLRQKCNLTSILHEAGHQALTRMGMVEPMAQAMRSAARGTGSEAQQLAGLWSFEIGPDFWSFCLSGIGAAATLRDILALPPGMVYRVVPSDPHPPPYLRALLGFECCRQLWGRGIWDQWERDWRETYPLSDRVPQQTRRILQVLESHVRRFAETLLSVRLRVLGGRRLTDLFDLRALHPERLDRIVAGARQGRVRLTGLPAAAHLAVFRLMRERLPISEEALDEVMSRWLMSLAKTRGQWSEAS